MKPHLQPQAGFKDLAILMELIGDPKKYKKIVAEQQKMLDEINNSLEVKATLEQAATKLSEASQTVSESNKILREAEAKAEEIKTGLLADLAKKEIALEESDKKMTAKYDEFNKTLSDVQDALDSKEQDLKVFAAELNEKSDKLSNLENSLTEKQATIEENSKLMKETAAHIG